MVLKTKPSWATAAGRALGGSVRVHRRFEERIYGVRARYEQDLLRGAVKVVVLLDGVPAKVIEEEGQHGEALLVLWMRRRSGREAQSAA